VTVWNRGVAARRRVLALWARSEEARALRKWRAVAELARLVDNGRLDGRCVAVSDSVMVSIDPESRRSAPMTEQARALLAPWQVADPATPG
jgi:hypothetical protein